MNMHYCVMAQVSYRCKVNHVICWGGGVERERESEGE